jgi:hypothetical protein
MPFYTSDERFHLLRPAYAIEPQAADRERAVGASAIRCIKCERGRSHRMTWCLERLNSDVAVDRDDRRRT